AGYEHINPLPESILNNAQALRDLLIDPAHCGYPPENVRLLLDEHATRAALVQGLADLAAQADADSTVLVYLSGQEITTALRAIPARKVVVIFDCCHAGGVGQPMGAAASALKPGLSDAYYDSLVAGQGRVIMASSRDSELSWALSGDPYSLFSKHLL